MSISGLLNIGKTAMLSSQAALAVTSNNIANVNTPGFSRQEVILGISSPTQSGGLSIGNGVTVEGVRRNYDSFIQTQILGQSQNQGRSTALDKAFSEVEQVFNESGDLGISGALSDFFNAWQEVAANPEGQPQRTLLIQKANSLVQRAQAAEQGLTGTINQINEEIDGIVSQVNGIATKIASLNGQIIQAEAGQQPGTAIGFRDQRDKLISDLGNLVDTAAYESQDGSLTVLIGSRNLVSGSNAKEISSAINPEGNSELFLDNTNITQEISKGQLGGFLSARDEIAATPLTDLRKLIASVVKEVNLQHQSGYGLDGSTGNDFFGALQVSGRDYSEGADISVASITDLSQLTLEEYNITFDAANNYSVRNAQTGSLVTSGAYVSGNPINFDGMEVTISGAVSASDRFFISPLTDAVGNFSVAVSSNNTIAAASAASGLPGDGSNAVSIGELSDSTIANLGDSFSDFYRSIVSYAGTASQEASDSLAFENNLADELNTRREEMSGVSLDEEAINMIRFQRAFEAGARMVSVTDELLQTILNL